MEKDKISRKKVSLNAKIPYAPKHKKIKIYAKSSSEYQIKITRGRTESLINSKIIIP